MVLNRGNSEIVDRAPSADLAELGEIEPPATYERLTRDAFTSMQTNGRPIYA